MVILMMILIQSVSHVIIDVKFVSIMLIIAQLAIKPNKIGMILFLNVVVLMDILRMYQNYANNVLYNVHYALIMKILAKNVKDYLEKVHQTVSAKMGIIIMSLKIVKLAI